MFPVITWVVNHPWFWIALYVVIFGVIFLLALALWVIRSFPGKLTRLAAWMVAVGSFILFINWLVVPELEGIWGSAIWVIAWLPSFVAAHLVSRWTSHLR